MFGSQIWVKDSVVLRGQGPLSSILRMKASFSQSTHCVYLGNKTTPTPEASFDTRLEALQVQCPYDEINADYNIAVVYSNNTQHTGGLRDVLIYGGHRVCCFFETGYGGAAYVTFEHVETNNAGGYQSLHNNPQWIINYGTTVVRARAIVMAAPLDYTNSIGMAVYGGIVDIEDLHVEETRTGVTISINDDDLVSLKNITGGNHVTDLIQIQNGSTNNQRITVDKVAPNGSSYSVLDGRSGHSSITTMITTATDL